VDTRPDEGGMTLDPGELSRRIHLEELAIALRSYYFGTYLSATLNE